MSSLFCSFLILSLSLLFSSSNALQSKLSQEVVIRASSLSPSSSLTTCVVTSCFLAGCLLEASGTVGESAVQDFLVLFLGPCGVLCFLFAACFWLDVEVGSPLHRLCFLKAGRLRGWTLSPSWISVWLLCQCGPFCWCCEELVVAWGVFCLL